jgi:hypothetical protein
VEVLHAVFSERAEALLWLEKALDRKDREMPLQRKVDPFLRDLRGEPRFQSLLRRMNLAPDDAAGGPGAAPPAPSIAVLPFADLSPKHDRSTSRTAWQRRS